MSLREQLRFRWVHASSQQRRRIARVRCMINWQCFNGLRVITRRLMPSLVCVCVMSLIVVVSTVPRAVAADWTKQATSSTPSARCYHAMASIGADQVLLFGGYDSTGNNDDTWVYDLSDDEWSDKDPASQPLRLQETAMANIDGNPGALVRRVGWLLQR